MHFCQYFIRHYFKHKFKMIEEGDKEIQLHFFKMKHKGVTMMQKEMVHVCKFMSLCLMYISLE